MATERAPLFGILRHRTTPRAAHFLAVLVVVAAATIRTWRPHIWLRMATSVAHDANHPKIGDASISQLLEELQSGRVTSKQLVEVSEGRRYTSR